MCGIIGLHLRDPALHPMLGRLLDDMLCGVSERGPDSVGIAVYGDEERNPPGHAAVSVLRAPGDLATTVAGLLPGTPAVTTQAAGDTTVLTAPVAVDALIAAVAAAAPGALVVGSGTDLVVYKGAGHPQDLARTYGLRDVTGWQGLAHTRMATESAINPEGCHPYSVGADQCLVHNGSFSNHATIRRELARQGVVFDSENDSEVGARFVAACLAEGDDLEKALLRLGETFDGFYTLLVTTADGFAVVRDEIACKPAVIAEHPRWVAMASEFRALADLPGIDEARIFEPDPGKVYTWQR
ncbi:class II glutamine amidotransferase domain-containing protein [Actinomycetospora lemnae]|uniref:glutamine--fructose-6-phosphate transaminase (isomerizing) n=1 Tax=Actinomycetospora lemnae TaxID=3019891 RepID=A0ABT5T1Q3_9PSEU|nr:glutamine amidotransferase [Actinomycetospora sp. DW7H6]MDD7968929.1 glutamine amidotransferase [Actinomycetospora sp. DW7H6]